MKMLLFARRNGQEILRDPLNLAFGLVFPLSRLPSRQLPPWCS